MDKSFAIFDMDGTLLDSMYYWMNLTRAYLDVKGIEATEELVEELKLMTMEDRINYMSEHYDITDTAEDIYRISRENMARFYTEKVELKEGVREYLDYLKAKGVKMSVATLTAMELTRPALERHGLIDYFETILTCSDLGIDKDTPRVYEMAAEHMGCKPEEAAVFEDSPQALQSAVNGGFYSVLIYDENMEELQEPVRGIADAYCVDMNELRVDKRVRKSSDKQ